MKASDVTDEAFLDAVREVVRIRTELDNGQPWTLGASRWDLAAVLAGHPEHVGAAPVAYPEIPEGVVLAKARNLLKRGLITGCACGCRGDFEQRSPSDRALTPVRRLDETATRLFGDAKPEDYWPDGPERHEGRRP